MKSKTYQGITLLSQAKNLPESDGLWEEIILIKYSVDWAGVKSLSLGTADWKGFDNFVSQVPGCKIETIENGNFLCHSILRVFNNWFCAALDALYEYQPPSLLSLILPTLALKLA